MTQSDFPFRASGGIDQELARHLEKQSRRMARIAALSQLSASATSAEIAAKVNEIITAAGQG